VVPFSRLPVDPLGKLPVTLRESDARHPTQIPLKSLRIT
jgi:hypothetical protein